MTRQLAFDLPTAEAMTREDFFVAPSNTLALQAIDGWRDWPGRKLLLVGPEGSGKTHLARIWAAAADAVILSAEGLGAVDVAGLSGRAVVVEDADRIGAAEVPLFHLHNLVTGGLLTSGPVTSGLVTGSGALLLTARTPPRDWGLGLPDLASRMQATPIAELAAPDDALLSAVLVKLFADRQIAVPSNLIPYLVTRMSRSVGAARALVADLDAAGLAAGRPVTRALASTVLDRRGSE